MRKQRCVGGDHKDDGAPAQLRRFLRGVTPGGLCCRARGHARGDPGPRLRKTRAYLEVTDFASYGSPQHVQIAAIVALHQHTQRVLPASHGHKARGGPDATLESISDHASAPPNRTFLHRPALRRVERGPGMLRLDMFSVSVIQGVEGFGNNRIREDKFAAMCNLPMDGSVADHSHTMCSGQEDRTFQEAGLFDPIHPCHIAIAILIEYRGHHEIPIAFRAGQDGSDTGPNGSLPRHELSFTSNQSDMANGDPRDISDRVVWSRRAVKRDAQGATSRILGQQGGTEGEN